MWCLYHWKQNTPADEVSLLAIPACDVSWMLPPMLHIQEDLPSTFLFFHSFFPVVEGSIAQAVPEHTKRDNIFCLSTAFGDAYLLQATTQIELENWITAIHSGKWLFYSV